MMLRRIPKTEKEFYLIYVVWIVILLLHYGSGGVLMIIFFPLFIFYQAFIPLSVIFSINLVKGYWGKELILTGYFTRGLKGYKLIDPYPQVSLIGSQGIWYLEYESNSNRKRVMIERIEGEDFKIDLNASK